MEIKNRDEIIDELTEMLMDFDKDMKRYQTDVYCYIDDEGNATLDEFVNVGGNSWRDDEHYVVCVDREHYESEFDAFQDMCIWASAIGISEEDLIKEVAESEEMDEDEVDHYTVRDYIEHKDNYMEKIHNDYCEDIDEHRDNYYDRACELISELENNIDIEDNWED